MYEDTSEFPIILCERGTLELANATHVGCAASSLQSQLDSGGKSRGVSRLPTQPLLAGTNYHIDHWQRRRHPRCPPSFQVAQSPRQNSGRNIWRRRHCWEGRPQLRPLFRKSGVPLKINKSCQWKQTERSVLVTVSDTQLAGVSSPSLLYPFQS